MGCPKNTVDSERLSYALKMNGVRLVEDEDSADTVVVNTCAFIRDAVDESLSAIFEASSKGKSVIVAGCLPGRYPDMLKGKIPEVMAFFGPHEQDKMIRLLSNKVKLEDKNGRELSTPLSYAYLKIADGCDRKCSYCIIPKIKGPQKSESPDDVYRQVFDLSAKGVREFILVAQDLTAYGTDSGTDLVGLLKRLCKVKADVRFRMLYLFPSALTRDLLDFIKHEQKIMPYFDIPVQHSSPAVLKRMKRPFDRKSLDRDIDRIRNLREDSVLRTTLITGFPGETEADFKNLVNFVKEKKFNHLGVFPFSKEEGSAAALLPNQISSAVAKKRADVVMSIQRDISAEHLSSFKGKALTCVVDGQDSDGIFSARNWYFAPEIDGAILVKSNRKLRPADRIKVKIFKTGDYDLFAEEAR